MKIEDLKLRNIEVLDNMVLRSASSNSNSGSSSGISSGSGIEFKYCEKCDSHYNARYSSCPVCANYASGSGSGSGHKCDRCVLPTKCTAAMANRGAKCRSEDCKQIGQCKYIPNSMVPKCALGIGSHTYPISGH